MTEADTHFFSYRGTDYCLDVRSMTVFALEAGQAAPLATLLTTKGPPTPGEAVATPHLESALAGLRERGFFGGAGARPPLAEFVPAAQADLLGLSLMVSGHCNLACTYCFNDGGAAAGQGESPMPTEVALQAVDFLLANSTVEVGIDFFGGEPLLAMELIAKVVEHADASGRPFLYSMITNGTLVDEAAADYFAAHHFHVVVSYDGYLHDVQRPARSGASTRERVRHAVRLLAERIPRRDISIRCIFTSAVDDVDKILDEARELGVRVLFGPATLPTGDRSAPTEADLARLVLCQERALEDALARGDVDAFTSIGAVSNTVLRAMNGRPRFFSCGLGKDILGVSASGDLYPCHRLIGLPAFRMGSLATGIDQAWFARFAGHSVDNRRECAACWARYFCGGGCAHDAWVCSDGLFGVAESRCAFQRAEIETGLKLYAAALGERPDLLTEVARRAGMVQVRPFDTLRAEKETS